MFIDDALLPAAPYLTGPHARDVIEPVVLAAGGTLGALDPLQITYRPGRELVVSFAGDVTWPTGVMTETLLAATTPTGAPPGALALEATDDDDQPLRVGVWRYPFDPVLPGLNDAVYPQPVAALLGLRRDDISLAVRSYRPCRRTVVHAAWDGGEAYIKVLPPAETAGVVERHARLHGAGLDVPEVIAADVERGIIAMRALGGEELRQRLLASRGAALPDADEYLRLSARLASIDGADLDVDRPSLLDAAPRHAAMLRRVDPSMRSPLRRLLEQIRDGADVSAAPVTIHGDLHEAQLRVDASGSICGLLDIDDVGPGDPLDDLARSIGHLIALALLTPGAAHVLDHARCIRNDLAERLDADQLDRRIAAGLIGLATGPFRSQVVGWQDLGARIVTIAQRWLDGER